MSPSTDPVPANVNLRQVGRSLPRIDAPGKATGETRFAGDYVMPGMLHAKLLRSPLASARLRRLDVSRARALAGVACVLTAADLTERNVSGVVPGHAKQKPKFTDQPILVSERVRYYGEPIAMVAAETVAVAEKALELIELELEPLPGVYDPFDAMEPGAPVVQGTDNVLVRHKIRKGDVEAGFKEADLVIENTYRTQFVEHVFLETEVGLGWVDENDVINVRVSTQGIEHFRPISEAIGVAHNKLRILSAMVGGAFGGKEEATLQVYVALLAKATRRPVQLAYSREESFLGHGKRHPFTMTYRTGVTRDGKITALKANMTADAGAYVGLSPPVALLAAICSPGPYRVDNLHVDSAAVATNNISNTAFRGFGGAQACVAYEAQMDELAKALGMDKLEFRRRNFVETGDLQSTGVPIESAVWTEPCMTRAWEALGERTPDRGPVRVGRGVACYLKGYGVPTWRHDTAEAWVGIELDGSVAVRSGVTDIGAGQVSSLAQIAAEILGVTLDDVVVYNSDSAVTPLGGMSSATRALYMTGNAVRDAATAVLDRLVARAAKALAVNAAEVDIADSRVFAVDDPDNSMTLKDLVGLCAADGIHRSELILFRAPFSGALDPETGQGSAQPDYTYGCEAVEVTVDIETGEVNVLKAAAAHDVGQAINPIAVEGQIEGGALIGQGFALSEDMRYEEGRPVTPSLSEYLIPTAMDVPEFTSIILESRSGVGPFGAKGIGEASLLPAAPAIANAVADAIGTRIFELPITAERVVAAMRQKEAAE